MNKLSQKQFNQQSYGINDSMNQIIDVIQKKVGNYNFVLFVSGEDQPIDIKSVGSIKIKDFFKMDQDNQRGNPLDSL